MMFNKYSRWKLEHVDKKYTEDKYYYFFDEGEATDAVSDLTKLGCICEHPRLSKVCETDEGKMWLVSVMFPI